MIRRFAVVALALVVSSSPACRSAAPPPHVGPPPPPPGATAQAPKGPPPTGDRLEIRWVRASAEYEAAVRQAYRMAEDHVERAAAGRAAST